jgi:hypothetical protein
MLLQYVMTIIRIQRNFLRKFEKSQFGRKDLFEKNYMRSAPAESLIIIIVSSNSVFFLLNIIPRYFVSNDNELGPRAKL